MWYVIPDLQNLDCSNKDINAFEAYYEYIKEGRFQIGNALCDIFGYDIASVIMLYVPDFLHLYKDKLQLTKIFK